MDRKLSEEELERFKEFLGRILEDCDYVEEGSLLRENGVIE